MPFTETLFICLVLLVISWIVFSIVDQRRRLKRDLDRLLKAAVVHFPDNDLQFVGSDAKILLRDYIAIGNEDTGSGLSAKYLCKMPDSRVYSVFAESARNGIPASLTVALLDDAEIADLIAAYPYLTEIQTELKHGV